MFEFIISMIFLFALINGLRYGPYISRFYKSDYGSESGLKLFDFLHNTGNFGEGLTFFELEEIPTYSKIITNIYIPTEDGTTELDMVYITSSAIYVIESKNYSGWIFGNEKQRNWTSVIYKSKNKFFNPIWQNKKHIKYLKNVLGEIEIKSIIVFSNRCEFKKLDVGDNIVIKRNKLKETIQNDLGENVFTKSQIDGMYRVLKRYSNQSEEVKNLHIKSIEQKRSENKTN